MSRMLVIANADAGSSDQANIRAAVSVLRDAGEVEVAETQGLDDLQRVLDSSGDGLIVVAGGDGSLHAVVGALHRRDGLAGRTLGLLPLGTGNDFARSLNLPLTAEDAAHVIVSGSPRPVDLIVEKSGEIVVNSVHVGAGVQASQFGAQWKSRLAPLGLGALGYPVGAARTALRPKGIRLTVEVDGEAIARPDRRLLMVAIGNGSSVGGGAPLTPDADPGDGYLDVMVSQATGPLARFGYAFGLGVGRHPGRSDVTVRRAKEVTVRGGPFLVSADGELGEPRESRSWRVLPAAYRVLVPNSE